MAIPEYTQLGLQAFAEIKETEVSIDNLVVASRPYMKKSDLGDEWTCTVSYQRDLWHQEDHGSFVLHAIQYAETVKSKHIKLNDVITVRGIPWTQTVSLRGGRVKLLHHLNVLDMTVSPRPPGNGQLRRGW